ncbi:MAG: OmpA family protein [Betaproteobacteria bacterium]|nr:OmpA family protein [Betaproteobacteria bacterium]
MIKKLWAPLLLSAGVALSAVSVNALAQANPNEGYWTSSNQKDVWKSGTGLCWRAGYWTPAMATEECDPELVKKAAAPAPAPAPAPTPAPAPRPVAQKITLSADVLFDFDKSALKPAGKEKLDELVGKIKDINLEVIIAVGYTDRIGSVAYNQRLSVRRAESVKRYFVSKGIEANRIYTEGKGKSQPVKTCPRHMKSVKALIACLAPNRRVEIEVIGTRK